MRGAASCAVVLGSGLSKLLDGVESLARVPYGSIPGFGRTSVEGHPGFASLCRFAGSTVLFFAGRFHAYEGAGADTLAAPVSLAKRAGCSRIIVTNAAGSLSGRVRTRSWMLATDVVAVPSGGRAVLGREPPGGLPGPAGRSGGISLVSAGFSAALERAALEARVPLAKGILCWTGGPTYETAAEARVAAFMGAHAASMSSLPELIAARRLRIEAACLSWITNDTAALSGGRTDHEDVLAGGEAGARSLGALIAAFLRRPEGA